jgi:hypothetical protein
MAATFRAEDRIVAAFGASRTRGGAIREIGIDGSVRRDLLATGRAAISDLSVSRDGERIAFLSAPPQTDVHIGELGPGGHSLSALHRVTLSDGDERPSAFAQDGTVLVVGDEFGGEHAMGVDPETGLAQPLFKDTWTTWTASAGGLVVAFRLEPHATDLVDVSLVNSHGRARSLGSEALPPRRGRPLPYDRELRCAMASCVLAAVTEAGVTLSLVEPETLTSQPLGTMSEIDAIRGFALARDGARVAILDRAGNFSIAARDGKRLTTVRHPEGCSPRWATFNFEGDALIATMLCDDAKPFQIRRIPLVGGPSQILASSNDAWYGNPVVSPDGSHLAITVEQFAANVQVLEVLDGGS